MTKRRALLEEFKIEACESARVESAIVTDEGNRQ